jgi:hypothetical protein
MRQIAAALRLNSARDLPAHTAAFTGPLAARAILLPFRSSWSNTNVALLLVAVMATVSRAYSGSPVYRSAR